MQFSSLSHFEFFFILIFLTQRVNNDSVIRILYSDLVKKLYPFEFHQYTIL